MQQKGYNKGFLIFLGFILFILFLFLLFLVYIKEEDNKKNSYVKTTTESTTIRETTTTSSKVSSTNIDERGITLDSLGLFLNENNKIETNIKLNNEEVVLRIDNTYTETVSGKTNSLDFSLNNNKKVQIVLDNTKTFNKLYIYNNEYLVISYIENKYDDLGYEYVYFVNLDNKLELKSITKENVSLTISEGTIYYYSNELGEYDFDDELFQTDLDEITIYEHSITINNNEFTNQLKTNNKETITFN